MRCAGAFKGKGKGKGKGNKNWDGYGMPEEQPAKKPRHVSSALPSQDRTAYAHFVLHRFVKDNDSIAKELNALKELLTTG